MNKTHVAIDLLMAVIILAFTAFAVTAVGMVGCGAEVATAAAVAREQRFVNELNRVHDALKDLRAELTEYHSDVICDRIQLHGKP